MHIFEQKFNKFINEREVPRNDGPPFAVPEVSPWKYIDPKHLFFISFEPSDVSHIDKSFSQSEISDIVDSAYNNLSKYGLRNGSIPSDVKDEWKAILEDPLFLKSTSYNDLVKYAGEGVAKPLFNMIISMFYEELEPEDDGYGMRVDDDSSVQEFDPIKYDAKIYNSKGELVQIKKEYAQEGWTHDTSEENYQRDRYDNDYSFLEQYNSANNSIVSTAFNKNREADLSNSYIVGTWDTEKGEVEYAELFEYDIPLNQRTSVEDRSKKYNLEKFIKDKYPEVFDMPLEASRTAHQDFISAVESSLKKIGIKLYPEPGFDMDEEFYFFRSDDPISFESKKEVILFLKKMGIDSIEQETNTLLNKIFFDNKEKIEWDPSITIGNDDGITGVDNIYINGPDGGWDSISFDNYNRKTFDGLSINNFKDLTTKKDNIVKAIKTAFNHIYKR